ncbi:MAG: hypothetical protein AAGN66_03150 [Acidobacteriota bacterium]
MKKNAPLWIVALALGCLMAPAAFAQICDETVREQYAQAVLNGVEDSQLEAMFGHCRNDPEEPFCTQDNQVDVTAELLSKALGRAISFPAFLRGSTFYEDMRRCGYHPQREQVACVVEVKRRFGYGGFPGGSNQHVLFCFDCDLNGTYEYTTRGSVHVTNDISGSNPRWYFDVFSSTANAPFLCRVNDGQATNVRAILSWNTAPRNCTWRPIWGRAVDFTARRDP